MQLCLVVGIRLGINALLLPANVRNIVQIHMDVSILFGWQAMNPNVTKNKEIVFCYHQTSEKQEVDLAILDQFAASGILNAVRDTQCYNDISVLITILLLKF